jgi:hypothetical protein
MFHKLNSSMNPKDLTEHINKLQEVDAIIRRVARPLSDCLSPLAAPLNAAIDTLDGQLSLLQVARALMSQDSQASKYARHSRDFREEEAGTYQLS